MAVFRPALLLSATGFLVTGCVPYPIYKTLNPEAAVKVTDIDGHPLAAAQVTLITRSHPTVRYDLQTHATDENGFTHFDALREWRIELLALHGAEIFYWNWCVRKDGYVTYHTTYGDSADFASDPTVRLERGESTPCPSR